MSLEQMPEGAEAGVAGFIAKTFEILSNDEYAKIIQWGHLGRQFIIKDINKFQQIVLPHYFRHNKMNSFVRQLNMYGFHKSRKDSTKCIFSHPMFLKDRDDLLISIKRKIKENEITAVKTPIKEKACETPKQVEETCLKEYSKEQKKATEQNYQVLTSFLQSRNRLNSFVNLSMSLKKLSANNLDLLQQNQDDDNISIANQIQFEERQKQKAPILNPSFFFRSFNSMTLN